MGSIEANNVAVGKTTMHRLIAEEGAVLMPGVQDAFSAAIAAKTGFKACFVSGFGVSAALLGLPDFGLLTTTEVTQVTSRITAASPNLCVIVDGDTGGGGPLNVQRFIKDLIAAGAKGVFLEDQVWPKKCGHMRGKMVVPAEEHALKIAAAREAIGDDDFFLVARTDARAPHGLQEAIKRANLYKEAGADATFVEAPANIDELNEVVKGVKGLRIANMIEGGKTPLHTPAEFQEMGFHLIAHSLSTLYATTKALMGILRTLKEKGTTRDDFDQMVTFNEFNDMISLESWYEVESKFKNFTPKV
ncbi:petal death protein isoform X1 [Beta vulgaris subsp. vulgaris]|uniref:petal death protein isoform X1 n=1 Tax=Beta vulgaris subsp. vulgaris TaxID=3555 RepID=UPI0020370743|nr:petal death protein isoform X1 [Beta vulgaris subsp. vulgaris]